MKGGKEGPALPLALVGIGIGVMGLGSPAPNQGGIVTIPNLPNGTLLLDKSDESPVVKYYAASVQNIDLTTTTSFNVGEVLIGTATIGLETGINTAYLAKIVPTIEDLDSGLQRWIRYPATGAGDQYMGDYGVISISRTLTSSGTKLFRLACDLSGIAQGAFIVWNRRIYRVKNASS